MRNCFRRQLLIVLAFLPLTNAWGQHELLTGYTWEATPTFPDAARLDGHTDVLVKRNMFSQFDDGETGLHFYKVFHLQRYLGDVAAVEGSQTVELSTDQVIKVISIKARSITPDGKVHELKESDFRQRTDDRESSSELYFAFEGLQVGSMVEYIIFTEESANYNGTVARLQFSIPTMEQRYELIAPASWRFAFKGHNGAPMPTIDSSHADVLRYHLQMPDMAAFESERSSYPDVHRAYLVYKLDAVPEKNILDISGYTSATRNYHKAVYPELSSKTRKELSTCIKHMDLAFARDPEDRIRTLDEYVRKNFGVVEAGSGLADLDQILRTKNCNEFGLTRLYANLFRELGIEHQLVLTNDRSTTPFDPEFEAHLYLNSVLFYFPEIKKYMEPSATHLGLGYPTAELMATYGLFIRNVEVGGVFAGVGSIKPIPSLPAEATRHDLVIDVSFDDEVSIARIKLKNELSGYYAGFSQNYYMLLNEEERAKLLRGNLEYMYEGATSTDITAENAGVRYFGVKPFTIQGTVVTPMFTDAAGADVLFRVGDLIGPQVEMYVEKPRLLPVDEDYNRYYDRRINVQLPTGWSCADLTPLSIHKTLEMDGKVVAEFRSTATMKENVIAVEVIEYYREQHVPLEQFEAWRSVINAAADFNKRALLFTKG